MRLFAKNQSKSYSLKPFLGLLCLTFFLMSFTLLSLENSEMMANEHLIFEEKVQIKMEKNTDEFVLFIADNSIYTQAKNEKHTLWLDDVQLPLNSTYSVRYTNLKGMLELNEGAEYRIYSKEFLSRNNKIKLEAKNESDVVYRFHTNGGKYYTTEFDTFKDDNITTDIESSKANINPDNTSKHDQFTVNGPVELSNRDLLESNQLTELSKLNKLESTLSIKAAKEFIFDLVKTEDTVKFETKALNEMQISVDSVLIVLDDKILGVGSSNLSELAPNKISSICVLKGQNAVEKYGKKAEFGVIEIYTKDDFTEEERALLINSFDRDERNHVGLDKENQPLYFVDGVPAQQTSLKYINPNQIEKIEVLKGEKAIKKHGKKAKNGVVEIYIKKGNE